MSIHQNSGRPLGIQKLHAAVKHPLHRGLDGQIHRERQRFATIGGIAQHIVKSALNTSDTNNFGRIHAFAAKARAAQDMSRQFAVRIEPHFTRPKHQARIADIMHRLHLLRA